MRRPGVYPEAAFAANTFHVVLVEDLEQETEPRFEFLLPLKQHRRRAGHDDLSHLLAKEQFAGDEAGLNGLAEPHVVSDEQIDTRKKQCLPERFKLVGVQLDTGGMVTGRDEDRSR